MRQLSIYIAARAGVPSDNEYSFNIDVVPQTDPENDLMPLDKVYSLSILQLNYSILTSSATSTMILTMNQPVDDSNILKSGQYVTITDNGQTVFEGVILTCNYQVLPMSETSQGNTILEITLAPSIYQFTIAPVIFDNVQAQQISTITGVSVPAILAGGVTQSVNTGKLLDYMQTNMDYNYFGKTIEANNLGDNLYLMANVNDPKDTVIRSSIDFFNCVFYQQEDGQILIRQLDYALAAPFEIDVQNEYIIQVEDSIPIIPLLTYNYTDNAYSTPAAISNYAILPPEYAVASNATAMVLTYAPNSQFFPRLAQLQAGGWFVGMIGNTQINDNIISNPTTATALKEFVNYPEAFIKSTKASGVKDQFVAAYQALLTAKETGNAIAGYSAFSGTISLDDPHVPTDFGNIIGKIIQIHNLSNMPNGIIVTASRLYSVQGSYMTFSVAPPGSYSGYWKNSNTQ